MSRLGAICLCSAVRSAKLAGITFTRYDGVTHRGILLQDEMRLQWCGLLVAALVLGALPRWAHATNSTEGANGTCAALLQV